MFRKWFKIFMICLVIVLFLIKVIPQLKENVRCETHNEFIQTNIKGIVFKKYVDSTEHSNKTLLIKNIEDSSFQKLLLDLDVTNLYNDLNVNDTIYKKIGSDSLFIFKNQKNVFFRQINFGCKQ